VYIFKHQHKTIKNSWNHWNSGKSSQFSLKPSSTKRPVIPLLNLILLFEISTSPGSRFSIVCCLWMNG